MFISKAGRYGIQVSLHLATTRGRRFIPVHELADRCGAPHHFLGKVCHGLTRAGILASAKGPHGGVALARPADRITLLQIVEEVDGLEGFEGCVLGLDPCEQALPCPVHDQWSEILDRMRAMLGSRSLEDLAHDVITGQATLACALAAAAGHPIAGRPTPGKPIRKEE